MIAKSQEYSQTSHNSKIRKRNLMGINRNKLGIYGELMGLNYVYEYFRDLQPWSHSPIAPQDNTNKEKQSYCCSV